MTTMRLLPLGIAGAALLSSGCGVGPARNIPATVTVPKLTGIVHGGQQPVAGAVVQLYAAGNTGYGSAYPYASGVSLLGTNSVTTNSGGSFTISGDFTCPSANTQVYLVGTGGNPGLGGGANANLALMAALGPCGGLTSSTFISVNELTTVASVWALSPFMTGVANIGTSANNAQGLANAFATVNKLVNIATGAVSGPALPAGAMLPISKIDRLADVLAACVNSAGGVAGDQSSCGQLFTYATVNGVAPTDTITAAMNIAQHPTAQVSSLVALAVPASPFQPTLSSTPNDLSLLISYTSGGISAPKGLAMDTDGNVWVANSNTNTVTKLANSGAPLSGQNGFAVGSLSSPAAIAIDASGNAWVSNGGNNTVSRLSADGTTGAVFQGGGMSAPAGLAADAGNNIWVANTGNSSITMISPSGTLANYSGAGVSAPGYVAIDPK